MPHVIVFDVIETLLDLRALDPHFQRIFGTERAREDWFNQMLQLALVSNIVDSYRDFSELGSSALAMTAERYAVQLSPGDRQDVQNTIRALPPHPDVQPALEQLRSAGFRLATLTNSTREVSRSQLEHAGLADFFEKTLSVDSVRRYKPAHEPYDMAAKELNVDASAVVLVAAHAWDIAGAHHAGYGTGFVARPGTVLDPHGPKPTYSALNLAELAQQLVSARQSHDA
ncbi:MAG: haloacid dehalogenase type II [Gemmatimonadaceae bacterium]